MPINPNLSSYSDSRSGVVSIYKPTGKARGRIFAFHGFGGSWRGTWKQNDVFWLQHLLHLQFPHCEICSVNWDGSDGFVAAGSIREHMRETPLDKRAPIVFIVHSFGVFDHVAHLLWGKEGNLLSFTPDLDCLRGVIFLGAPHHFMSLREGYTRNSTAEYYTEHFPENVEDIQRYLLTIYSLKSDFLVDLIGYHKMKVFSVWEKANISHHSEVLFNKDDMRVFSPTASDSELNLEQMESMSRSHSALSKFESAEDVDFVNLCSWLKDIFEVWLGAEFGSLMDRDNTWDVQLVPLSIQKPKSNGSGTAEYIGSPSQVGALLKFAGQMYKDRWVHIPTNNVSRTKSTFRNIWIDQGLGEQSNGLDCLGPIMKAVSNFPHSRYILPNASCISLNDARQGKKTKHESVHFRLVLPYLHWDTKSGANTYREFLKCKHDSKKFDPTLLPAFASFPTTRFSDYQPRRTLDQFYYSRLKDTSFRDNSQVVSKQNNTELSASTPLEAKVIMVDQLWLHLWLTHQSSTEKNSSTLLTAFPHSTYERTGKLDPEHYHAVDVRQQAFQFLEKDIEEPRGQKPRVPVPVDATNFAAHVIETSLLGTLTHHGDPSLDFLELFRQALGQITESHSETFRRYAAWIQDEGKTKGKRGGEHRMTEDPEDEETAQHVKMQQIELSLEVADIIDELNILKVLFQTQIQVLQSAFQQIDVQIEHLAHMIQIAKKESDFRSEEVRMLNVLRRKLEDLSEKLDRDYLHQVLRMAEDAERAQVAILHFLDLQQREENTREAQSLNQQALFAAKQAIAAQQQADATGAQNQILLIFTFVTIVFLPLSFITSYYGLNVMNEEGQQLLKKSSYVNMVMFSTAGSITVFLSLGGVIWFFVSKNSSEKQRINELARLKKNGDLPRRLLDMSDPLLKKVDKRIDEMVEEEKKKDDENKEDEEIHTTPKKGVILRLRDSSYV